jgi:hypothetical protein
VRVACTIGVVCDGADLLPSAFTDHGAPWVIRNDLGQLPVNNDDPALVPYKELINESNGGNDQKYFPLGQTAIYVNDANGAGSIIVNIILPFHRKASTNINLIFETPAPIFQRSAGLDR